MAPPLIEELLTPQEATTPLPDPDHDPHKILSHNKVKINKTLFNLHNRLQHQTHQIPKD